MGLGSIQVVASAIAVGEQHSCAIEAGSHAVICWGDNSGGQATPPPSLDGTEGTASAIAAGSGYSCAIQSGTGGVVCWASWTPPPSVDGTNGSASAIAAGGSHTLALPEPSDLLVLASGAALIAALARRRYPLQRASYRYAPASSRRYPADTI
jgi:hypothetical protein